MSLTLSAREQAAIASCSDTMVRPFNYSSLDEWRAAVLAAFSRIISADAAFFNFRRPPEGVRVAFSREFAGPLLDRYEQLCIYDAGYDRALETQLSALNQTMVVAGEWDAYHADPAVAGFYVPNQLLDSACLVVADSTSGLSASVELHSTRYGTRAFGARGVAILQLLLPSFRAGLTAVQHGNAARGQLAALLDASAGALQAIGRGGRCVHQTPRVLTLLQSDPHRADVLAGMAHLARRAAATAGSTKLREAALTSPCTMRVATPTASYRIEATRVSSFASYGVVMLVSLERLSPTPMTDVDLQCSYQLSPREIAVARQLALGASAQEIALALVMSVHTARRHSERVFAKLGVHARTAVAAALLRS